MKNITLSVILPVQNQQDSIKAVITSIISQLEKTGMSFEIITVENGSTDRTFAALKALEENDKRIRTMTAPIGYGSAVLTGLRQAKGIWVGYMPSDGQIDLSVLPLLLKELSTGRFDVVKVHRITRENFMRFIRSKVFYVFSTLVFGIVPVKDINGSPRFFRRKVLAIVDLHYTDSFIDLEFALKAKYLGWRIKEFPMKTLPRVSGKSTVGIKTVVEFIRNIIAYRFTNQFSNWKRVRT